MHLHTYVRDSMVKYWEACLCLRQVTLKSWNSEKSKGMIHWHLRRELPWTEKLLPIGGDHILSTSLTIVRIHINCHLGVILQKSNSLLMLSGYLSLVKLPYHQINFLGSCPCLCNMVMSIDYFRQSPNFKLPKFETLWKEKRKSLCDDCLPSWSSLSQMQGEVIFGK